MKELLKFGLIMMVAMAVNMSLRGVPDSAGIMVPFMILTALSLIVAVMLLRSVKS